MCSVVAQFAVVIVIYERDIVYVPIHRKAWPYYVEVTT